jgi:hypothetical protein
MLLRPAAIFFGLVTFAACAHAQLSIPSDGSDGALVINSSTTIDLSQAPTVAWNTPAPIPGKGVYDASQWAVVYKYSSVNISGQLGVFFLAHPSGAPVVWLVDGDVTIGSGVVVNLGGSFGASAQLLPGPGGFRGGVNGERGFEVSGSAGFGPGGGNYAPASGAASGGSFASVAAGSSGPTYGNAQCIPLLGGSGGSGKRPNQNTSVAGGAGGGAILIAAKGTITINGSILADAPSTSSGFGGGSGGAIRLVGNVVNVSGSLNASGQSGGGDGRIRIEAKTTNITGNVVPAPSIVTAVQTPQIWPYTTRPKVEIYQIGTELVPADPRAALLQPDVPLASGGDKAITVRAFNVPTDGTWVVKVRMAPRNGKESYGTCTFVSGNQGISLWQCTLNFDSGPVALIARANRMVTTEQFNVSVGPRATFLRVQADPLAMAPQIVDLSALGITPGRTVRLVSNGNYSFNGAPPEAGTAMIGVFASSSEVLSGGSLNRIPGAIASAGTPIVTATTFSGGLSTDIPQDFLIDGTTLTVPPGARYLIVGAHDVFFGDNADLDNNFALDIYYEID